MNTSLRERVRRHLTVLLSLAIFFGGLNIYGIEALADTVTSNANTATGDSEDIQTVSGDVSQNNTDGSTNFTVTLKNNVTKSVLSSKKIVFTLVDSNVSYNRTTNSSGKAALSIHKMGSYDIMVSFAGDKTYEEGNQTFTLNVSKGKTSKIS